MSFCRYNRGGLFEDDRAANMRPALVSSVSFCPLLASLASKMRYGSLTRRADLGIELCGSRTA